MESASSQETQGLVGKIRIKQKWILLAILLLEHCTSLSNFRTMKD